MGKHAARGLLCIGNLKHGIIGINNARIAHLTAAFGVKCGFIKHYNCLCALCGIRGLLAVCHNIKYARAALILGISHKFGSGNIIKAYAVALPAFRIGGFAGGTRHLALIFHKLAEFFLIYGHIVFG